MNFSTSNRITTISDAPVRICKIPTEWDKVYTQSGKEILLRECLNSGGGEGTIYKTDTQDEQVAKIYKLGKITKRKEAKLKLLTRIRQKGICTPTELLYNERDEFIGYLMPLAKGDTLKNTIFAPPIMHNNSLVLGKFPTWKKKDVVTLAITILEKIKYLHDRGILIGDIKGENILVVSQTEVYFVDTDSYQVQNFPCPVISEEFTPPELIGSDRCENFLRTVGNENFAVATLLFKIVMQGVNPYARIGGTTVIENIKSMEFSFPFGTSNFKTPGGSLGLSYCCWDHLSMKVRALFHSTFSKTGNKVFGQRNTELTRPNINEWLEFFRKYEYNLTNNISIDDESNEVFPTQTRVNEKDGILCKISNHYVRPKGFSKRGLVFGYCRECLGASFENKIYRCSSCKCEISYTGYDHYVKSIQVPTIGVSKCSKCDSSSNYEPINLGMA